MDPRAVVVLRHQPVEPKLRQVLPLLVIEKPELFLAYQRIQWASAERSMVKAQYVAAFIGQAPGEATFAGLYKNLGAQRIDYEGYMAFPGNAELFERGMTGMQPDAPGPLAFDLEAVSSWDVFVGRLVVAWPKPERAWVRWADRSLFSITALLEENRFKSRMKHWTDVVLTWPELLTLPTSWQAVLSQWRGVYFIYDQAQAKGYVGSASGEENILGRWRDYAQTGHGGNMLMRGCNPSDLSFSILQMMSPNSPVDEVMAVERSWKIRLHTRTHGLNAN